MRSDFDGSADKRLYRKFCSGIYFSHISWFSLLWADSLSAARLFLLIQEIFYLVPENRKIEYFR